MIMIETLLTESQYNTRPHYQAAFLQTLNYNDNFAEVTGQHRSCAYISKPINIFLQPFQQKPCIDTLLTPYKLRLAF